MIKYSFYRWVKHAFCSKTRCGNRKRRNLDFKPRLETYEDRIVPTVWFVTDPGDDGSNSNTLRYALDNAANGDIVEIEVPTVTLSSANSSGLTINADVTIVNDSGSPTATIDGAGLFTVFTINGGVTASISGLTIEDGSSGVGGGLYNSGNLTLTSCSINNSTASGFGGGSYNTSATIKVVDCSFNDNSGGATGGGISVSGGTANITSSSFNGNHALSGGGISVYGGNVTVNACNFTGNTASQGGGLWNIGNTTVNNSTFTGNSASRGGGIFNGGTLNATGDIFDSNFATSGSAEGGGIYNTGGSARISNCSFNGNTAALGGGLIAFSGNVTVSGSTFAENTASEEGGGIFSEAAVTITNSTISGNHAGDYGGGIFSDNTLSISGSTLNSNSAILGGAVLNISTLNATNCDFSENTASSWGAGIFNTGGTANVNSCNFVGNGAGEVGGGIAAESGILNISASNFDGNSAFYGGGVFNFQDSTAKITTSNFFNNVSFESGGGYDNQGAGTISDSLFAGNESGFIGGGVNSFGKLQITNSTFYENFASQSGGAISNYATSGSLQGSLSATDNTVVDNTAAVGGGIFTADGRMVLKGNIIVGNTNTSGVEDDISGVAFSSSSSNNLVDVDLTGTLKNGSGGNLVGMTQAQADLGPLGWYGGPTETFALIPGSPAIGAGLSAGPTTDQRGLDRPTSGADIGAYQTEPSLLVNYGADSDPALFGDLTLRDAVNVVDINTSTTTIPITFAGVEYITLQPSLGTLTLGPTIAGTTIAPIDINESTGSTQVTFGDPTGPPTITAFTIDPGVTASISQFAFVACGGTGPNGGAIDNAGTLTLSVCQFFDNDAPTNGGAVYSTGSLTVTQSVFAGNSAQGGSGGAIYSSGPLSTINCTYYENQANASSGAGGAIWNSGKMSATDNTLYANSGGVGGGLYTTGSTLLNGDLIVGNLNGSGAEDDIDGSNISPSSSYNLVDIDNTGTLKNSTTNQTGVSAALAGVLPLAYNGGPTDTIGLSLGSYALGKGLDVTGTSYPNTDQIGNNRPGNGYQGDVGAYQFSNPPTIGQQPLSETITLPSQTTTSFSASASDIFTDGTTSVPTTVQWQISTDNGQTFTDILPGGLFGDSPDSTTLVLNGNGEATQQQLMAMNGDEFRAVFTNAAGESASTNIVTLNVDYAPIVTVQPASSTINSGDTATFTSAATGSPNVTASGVQWEYNNGSGFTDINNGGTLPDGLAVSIATTTLSSGSTSTLSIANANGSLSVYQFETVYKNTVGSTTTSAATLTVDSAPVVSPPTSQTVATGATNVTFSASAIANPPAFVEWYYSTNGGASFSPVSGSVYSGVNTDTLTISTVTAAMNGYEYEATFTNPLGSSTTTEATLTVDYAPVIIAAPSNAVVPAGTTATFTSAATGNPGVTGVLWKYNSGSGFTTIANGGTLPDGLTVSITTSTLPSANPISTLSIANPDGTASGYEFETVFTNSLGSTTTSAAALTVDSAPVVSPPTSQTVATGATNVAFTASAIASPAPSVKWYVSSNNGATFSLISGSIYSGVNADSLTISTVTAAMNGYEYEAVFTNEFGSTTTTAATLTVDYPPAITTQPLNALVNSGASISLTSAASSNPGVTGVQWEYNSGSGFAPIHNGGVLPDGLPVSITVIPQLPSANPSTTLSIAGSNGTLTGYEFETIFTNSAGSATTSAATISVESAPIVSPPTNQTVTAGATNVTIAASVVAIPAASVQWFVSTDGGATFNPVEDGGVYANATTPALTILGPVTAAMNGYEYAATFTNIDGSVTSSAATLSVNYAPIVTAEPANVEQMAGGTATFTAAANSNPGLSSIQWEYSNGGAFVPLKDGSFQQATVSGSGSGTLTISGLTSNLNGYQFEAEFTNSVGLAATSTASLTVGSVPAILSNPKSEIVLIGNNASFTATASGYPTPTVQWEVSSDGGFTFSPVSPGGVYGSNVTSTTLAITAAPVSMNGYEYEAIFSNGIGSAAVSATATMSIGSTPAVSANPSSAIINIGGTTSFTATSTSAPAASVQWEVNRNDNNGFVAITNSSIYSGATSNTLTVAGVTAAMNGYEYKAVYTNNVGSVASTAATLSDLGAILTAGPNVLLYSTGGNLVDTITPFGNNVTSVQAAVGYMSGGLNEDLVVASGVGGGQVLVYNGLTGGVATTISPYGTTYTAGLNIALGNVLSTNTASVDIVIGPGSSGKQVVIYNNTGTYVTGFYPMAGLYPGHGYTGGLHVATGNLSGTGEDTVVVGTAAPQAAHAGLYKYTGTAFAQVKVYTYAGEGVYVSTLAVTPGGLADLVVGTQTAATSSLIVQNSVTGATIAALPTSSLSIFDYGNTGQVRVGVADVFGDGVPAIVVTSGSGSTQEMRVFDLFGTVLGLEETLNAAELGLTSGYNGGLYVG